MGLFGSIKNSLYWRKHKEEQQHIESEGNILLTEFNDLTHQMNVCPNVVGYSHFRDRLMEILDWFEILDKRGCPYQLIGGADNKRREIAKVFNNGLNYAVKRNTDDFDLAIKLLLPVGENYSACKKVILQQKEENCKNFNGTGARFLSILENHFIQDNIIAEPLIACGIPEDVVLSRDTERIDSYKPKFESEQQKSDFTTYFLALKKRYQLAHSPLLDYSVGVTNLNLHNDEKLFTIISSVSVHKEVVVSKNVRYGGIRWQYGFARGGNVNYTTNAIKNFRIQDIGTLYITSERIIFIGKQVRTTITIPLSSVLSYDLFKDGVLLRITNHENGILLRFEPMQRYDGMLMLQDGMNNFISVIERIMNHTTDEEI